MSYHHSNPPQHSLPLSKQRRPSVKGEQQNDFSRSKNAPSQNQPCTQVETLKGSGSADHGSGQANTKGGDPSGERGQNKKSSIRSRISLKKIPQSTHAPKNENFTYAPHVYKKQPTIKLQLKQNKICPKEPDCEGPASPKQSVVAPFRQNTNQASCEQHPYQKQKVESGSTGSVGNEAPSSKQKSQGKQTGRSMHKDSLVIPNRICSEKQQDGCSQSGGRDQLEEQHDRSARQKFQQQLLQKQLDEELRKQVQLYVGESQAYIQEDVEYTIKVRLAPLYEYDEQGDLVQDQEFTVAMRYTYMLKEFVPIEARRGSGSSLVEIPVVGSLPAHTKSNKNQATSIKQIIEKSGTHLEQNVLKDHEVDVTAQQIAHIIGDTDIDQILQDIEENKKNVISPVKQFLEQRKEEPQMEEKIDEIPEVEEQVEQAGEIEEEAKQIENISGLSLGGKYSETGRSIFQMKSLVPSQIEQELRKYRSQHLQQASNQKRRNIFKPPKPRVVVEGQNKYKLAKLKALKNKTELIDPSSSRYSKDKAQLTRSASKSIISHKVQPEQKVEYMCKSIPMTSPSKVKLKIKLKENEEGEGSRKSIGSSKKISFAEFTSKMKENSILSKQKMARKQIKKRRINQFKVNQCVLEAKRQLSVDEGYEAN